MSDASCASSTRTEWAVRYADGDMDICNNRDEAEADVAHAQHIVKKRRGEWQAYTGAHVVGRVIEERATDWTRLSARCPLHRLTTCSECGWTAARGDS